MGQKRQRRDRPDARRRHQLVGPPGELIACLDLPANGGFEFRDAGIEGGDRSVDVGGDLGHKCLGAMPELARPDLDQLVAAPRQCCQTLALRTGRDVGLRAEGGAKVGERAGIDAVGLGEPPARFGKAAGGDRIEPDIADAARGQRMTQQPVVMAGRLKDDDIAARLKAGGKVLQRLELVGNTPVAPAFGIEEIEGVFGDVAADEVWV